MTKKLHDIITTALRYNNTTTNKKKKHHTITLNQNELTKTITINEETTSFESNFRR